MATKLKRVFVFSLALIIINSAQIAHLNLDPPSEALAADIKSLFSPASKSDMKTKVPLSRDLDYAARISLPRYATAIRKNARAFGLDWRLVMAIMKQESQFAENAVSGQGAYGLMQVMPTTGIEVANQLGLENLNHPNRNIRGGVFYFAKLFDLFEGAPNSDRLKLATAAYNAGPGRIYDAQEVAAYLGENPFSWQVIEKVLPLLSKRFYTLHSLVWDGGKPRNGYFGKSRQTILYVRSVMENYERYKSMLN